MYWPMKVSNEEVVERTKMESVRTQVRKRRWRGKGHVLRMEQGAIPHTALTWLKGGEKEKRLTEKDIEATVEREQQELGMRSWAETSTVARDRELWRETISCPIPYKGNKTDDYDQSSAWRNPRNCSTVLNLHV